MRPSSSRAVFLDRDGTINEEVGYLSRIEDLRLIPGVGQALRSLRDAGFKLVIVSNQSGVARGLFTVNDVEMVNARLLEMLAAEGVSIDAVYYCPHLDGCDCRKPKTGMIERAGRELGLDPSRSYVIGDHAGDMALAANTGAVGVMVMTGHGSEERDKATGDIAPACHAADIAEAAKWILDRERKSS